MIATAYCVVQMETEEEMEQWVKAFRSIMKTVRGSHQVCNVHINRHLRALYIDSYHRKVYIAGTQDFGGGKYEFCKLLYTRKCSSFCLEKSPTKYNIHSIYIAHMMSLSQPVHQEPDSDSDETELAPGISPDGTLV